MKIFYKFLILWASVIPFCAQGETVYLYNQPPGSANGFQQGWEMGREFKQQRMQREEFAQQQALVQQQQRNLELQNELLERQLQKNKK